MSNSFSIALFRRHVTDTRKVIPILLTTCFFLCVPFFVQAQEIHGPFEFPVHEMLQSSGIPEQEMERMNEEALQNEMRLRDMGLLPERAQASVTLAWPLLASDGNNYDHTYIGNYYDHDTSGGVRDYNCGDAAYSGHHGTDFFLYPFPWTMLESEDVSVVAAAAGTIVFKQDGYDDTCNFDDNWNAVKVLHADGTAMWYGHLKKGTVTAKAVGQSVAQGEVLGKVGSSGRSGSPHLHMQLNQSNSGSAAYDPFHGSCNSAASRWQDQPAYYDPDVLALTSHSAAAEYTQCSETPHFSELFSRGDNVYLYNWYRRAESAIAMNHSVIRPDGSEFLSWSLDSATYYYVAANYTFFSLPANAMEGPWTYRVEYAGDTTEHTFCVESCTYTEPATAIPFVNMLLD